MRLVLKSRCGYYLEPQSRDGLLAWSSDIERAQVYTAVPRWSDSGNLTFGVTPQPPESAFDPEYAPVFKPVHTKGRKEL